MPLILAVDDSPSMRKMVSFTLTGAGYQVVEAVDGVDGYEKAQAQTFDLVLTDQNMPRLDGLGLTRKLRDHPQFKTVPILMLTTESSDLMKQAGRAAGATGWLVKPFDPARLLEVQCIRMVVVPQETSISASSIRSFLKKPVKTLI
jgi:two-component system, chemotaxis family, chemotaxis protein CheY